MSHAIPLGFAQIQCQRCSAIRIRGVTCPDCGAAPAPWEVDPQRQRRQRTVTAVLRRFDDTPSPTPPATVDLTELGAFAQTARWLEQFFLALQAAVGPTGEGESLREAVAEFVRLRAEIDAMPRLRPWLRLVDAAQAVIPALEDAARGFLSAVAADTPLEAQQAASRAQGWLDSATHLLQDYLGHLARWQRASEGSDLDELLLGLVRESRQVVGEPDLLQFDTAGAADFYDLTGEQCPSGFGVALGMLRLVAEGIGDADRFGRVLADAYRHLMAHTERLDRLVNNPTFKSDLSDALIKSIDTSQSAAILLAAALHPRQHVAVLLDTSHALFEGPGKRHAAALISVAKDKPYDRLRQADASAILRQADQAGFGQMLSGMDPAVRGARAHLSWALDGDDIVVTNREAVHRFTVPQLVDRVLTAQESVLALTFALTCAAATRGMSDLLDADFLQALGSTESGWISVLATSFGLHDVVVDVPDSGKAGLRWAVRGRSDGDLKPMSLAAAILPVLPVTADQLSISISTPTGLDHVEGPTECWKPWREAADESAKERAFIEACSIWRRNGDPVLGRAKIRKWAAIKTSQAAAQGYPAAVAPIKELRALAVRVDDSELAAAVISVITALRQTAAGNPGLVQEDDPQLKSLADWAGANVED